MNNFFLKKNFCAVLGTISLLVAMVAILSMVIMNIYHSKKQNYRKEEAEKKMFEDSYEALKTSSDESVV